MVVAVAAMSSMNVAVDQVIDVSEVRYSFVTAADAMFVTHLVRLARMIGRALRGRHVRIELMLVDVIAVNVMQVTVVYVIHVVVVHDRDVLAVVVVPMLVPVMDVVTGIVHAAPLAFVCFVLPSSASQCAQVPYSVSSWRVARKPRGRPAPTDAHPSSSYTRPQTSHEK